MNRCFRQVATISNVYLHLNPLGLRKSFRGLTAIVEQELEYNPFDGGLHAFSNLQHDKIMIFVALQKPGLRKLHWPGSEDEAMQLTGEQINFLLDGHDISRSKGNKNCIMRPHFECNSGKLCK